MRKLSEKWQPLADEIESQNSALRTGTFRNLLILSHIIEKYIDFKFSSDGFNQTQRMIVLSILGRRGFMTPTEISRNMLYIVDTVNKSINNLEKAGVTKSSVSKKDRRIRKVTLTEEGLNLAGKLLPQRYLAFCQAMDCFNEEEVAILQSLVKRLSEHVVRIMADESGEPKTYSSHISLSEPVKSTPARKPRGG